MGRRRNRHVESTASPRATRLLDRRPVERADSATMPAGVDWGYVRRLRKLWPPPYDPTPQPSDWRCPA